MIIKDLQMSKWPLKEQDITKILAMISARLFHKDPQQDY